MRIILQIVCLFMINFVIGANKLPTLEKCESEDGKCIQNLAEYIALKTPKIGLESMDPFYFETINASSSTLNLILKNITLIGLKNCNITHISLDLPKLIGGIHCNLSYDGEYEGYGLLHSLPFQGKGKMHMMLKGLKIFGDVDIMEAKGENNSRHWVIRNPRPQFELMDNPETKIVFDNLCDGDFSGSATRALIKDNPVKVFKEIGTPIVDAFESGAVRVINNIFKTVFF